MRAAPSRKRAIGVRHPGFLHDLEKCELCEHRCRVNRLQGETGVCRVSMPVVSSAHLHMAPPPSYTVFMAGCNFKCLQCQSWTTSQYPDSGYHQRGYEDPETLAEECLQSLDAFAARLIGAERISFSGGEPTIHLPYVEKVVEEARQRDSDTKVNVDTNGYMTEQSLEKVLSFATSITYDLKAYHDEVHLALTGASSKPVLRNAELIGRYARDQLWEYRIVVIPELTEDEVKPLTDFIAGIDPSLPVCFLAFRPNFVLQSHPGAKTRLMQGCVQMAKASGLKSVYWSGRPNIPGKRIPGETAIRNQYVLPGGQLAGAYSLSAGCRTHPRGCSTCLSNQVCHVKKYHPSRTT
ncbi:MAG: radical SAM protein [Thermodesulfobacteriota bacterium]|nr:radical SAM protein [Thermodesulfobacteriota bacterium]